MIYSAGIYLLFFFSGLSALIYQVLWVRMFSLIFGGSHLAVTTVLAVFMAGLALGGYLGRHTENNLKPLRLYGLLEIGIGISAFLLIFLLKIYPEIYVSFARLVDNRIPVLTVGRVIFAVLALLVPTTLMGLTLPVLSGCAGRQWSSLGKHLSFLYGVNTFGAVVGAYSAGFVLLRYFTVTTTYSLAIGISLMVGVLSLLMDLRLPVNLPATAGNGLDKVPDDQGEEATGSGVMPVTTRLILIGIGISGFCALGYEILWTRVLSIVIGTTVYGYTLMLVAFLTGIALGGASYRFILRLDRSVQHNMIRAVLWFGLIQIVIGSLAMLVSYLLRDLTSQTLLIESWLRRMSKSNAPILRTTNFAIAVLYMVGPAFLMGLAFPLAGDIVARARTTIGEAVGKTLTYNTGGAILGAAVSGYVLIYFCGIERSLLYLSLVNLAFGLFVCLSLSRLGWARWSLVPLLAALVVYLQVHPDVLRIWDTKHLAMFNHNARQAFATEATRKDIANVAEVLYYAEGTTSTVSVVKIKGASQGLNVNGRTVASTHRQDQQCQYTLGHLPMLLHKNPRKVWVLGMGTGMTAGATSVHPEVESVTVVELEKHVVPAARTFSEYNHDFLDNPKVSVVFNDGRNFLLTTRERYDVITADPIHPWSQGAAYLYTDEYYRLAASRLRTGGIMCQWLPIYELTPRDLQSVVRTFSNNFKYVFVWLTAYDAELIGSNEPVDINLDKLQKRIEASPEVYGDLKRVDMSSAVSFLSYSIMGPAGSRSYGLKGPLNTDNNLYLEFSAPNSKGRGELIAINIADLTAHREDISGYISDATLSGALGVNPVDFQRAVRLSDRAHIAHYWKQRQAKGYVELLEVIEKQFPWYAPSKFLLKEYKKNQMRIPRLLNETRLTLADSQGRPVTVTLSVVSLKLGPEFVRLLVVDNKVRKILGFIYVEGEESNIDELVTLRSAQLTEKIVLLYQQARATHGVPPARETIAAIKTAIAQFQARDN